MSSFDPHSIFQHKQRASKKGQVLRKKPIKQPRAYSGKDLADAKKVLKAYGIPYGISPAPPSPSDPTITSSSANDDLMVITTGRFNPPQSGHVIRLTDKMIMKQYLDNTQFGNWLTYSLDKSKVLTYSCYITAKNIFYQFNPTYHQQNDFYNVYVSCGDIQSEYEGTLTMKAGVNPSDTDPQIYVFKSVVGYWVNKKYLKTEVKTINDTNSQPIYVHSQSETTESNTIFTGCTESDLPLIDLVNGNYSAADVASSMIIGNLDYETDGYISTVVNVSFDVKYIID